MSALEFLPYYLIESNIKSKTEAFIRIGSIIQVKEVFLQCDRG